MADIQTFDPYEYTGVVAPGAIVAAAIFTQWPSARELLPSKDITLGEFGIFLVFAFVLGHLVQAIGLGLEALVFAGSGKPTDWMRRSNTMLVAPAQRTRLAEKLSAQQGHDFSLQDVGSGAWYAITREIYANVSAAGRAQRVDAFNRTYGLMRGIAAALVAVMVWLLVARRGDWRSILVVAILTGLTIFQMVHFARLYARELFVQFLASPDQKS